MHVLDTDVPHRPSSRRWFKSPRRRPGMTCLPSSCASIYKRNAVLRPACGMRVRKDRPAPAVFHPQGPGSRTLRRGGPGPGKEKASTGWGR